MEESINKFSNDESQTFSPRSNLKFNENTRKSLTFRNTSKTNESFKQGNHRKSLKTRKNINDKFSNQENELKVINKPSFSRFLYNTFSTFVNSTKESQDIDFTKFNVDSSTWALNKKKFNIAKTKKNGSTEINSYYDIVYNGAPDLNLGNSNLNIIENRIENTFKFNSERVIDSVIRSNKKQNEDIIMNDTMKNVGFSSPIKKFKNIFKKLKTNNESKENSTSNSFVNEEVKLNLKNANNKKKINLLTIKINPTIENNSTKNYNKTEIHFKNQTKDIKDLRSNSSLQTEYLQSSKLPPNSNGIDFQNSIKLQTKSNSFKNFQMNNSLISKFNASLVTEKNTNNFKNTNKEQSKSYFDLNKTNDNRKSKGLPSLKTLDSIETKNSNMIFKSNSYLNEYEEKRSESENILNQNTINYKKNFILKNIKLAKNYSRKNKTNNEELTIKRELKKKFHSLLTNDCQSFCIELKVKNQNFKEKINNHLISEKYMQKLKDFHKDFHFKGMSYNPIRYLINLDTIEKNFLTPEQVISEKLSPAELKIIQSDVGYFIKDPALIKENPDLKIKSLKDIMKEEEENEIKKKYKKKNHHLPSLENVFGEKKENHLKLTKKSFSSQENFFKTEFSNKKNLKKKSKENFISLLSSEQDRGFPRIDLINKQYERIYYDVEKKVGNKVLNENILNDNFDNFNSKLQEKIIRKGYEREFSSIPMRNPGDNLNPNQKHDHYIAKMAYRNEHYNKKVNDIYQKIGEKFVENNFVKSCINKLKQNFNYVRTVKQ